MSEKKGFASHFLESEARRREFRGENAGGLRVLADELDDQTAAVLGVGVFMAIVGGVLGDDFGGKPYAWGGAIVGFIVGAVFAYQLLILAVSGMALAFVFFIVDYNIDDRVEHRDPDLQNISSHPHYSDRSLRVAAVCKTAYELDDGWFHGWKIEELEDWEHNIACTTADGVFGNCAISLPDAERRKRNQYRKNASRNLKEDPELLAKTVQYCSDVDARFSADNDAMLARDHQIEQTLVGAQS